MAKTLRVGIVGLGAVARVHLAAYMESPNIRIVGVADTNLERVRFAKEELGLPTFLSLDEMLEKANLDICCVLTPPASHEMATLQCASAGVSVLCEKPLALSVEACERMIEGCQNGGVRLCYGASYRYLPAVSAAREMILRGEIGEVLLLREYAVGGNGLESRQPLAASHYPVGGPGGTGMGLCDHGIHLIDAFGWMMNSSIVEVSGRGNITGAPLRPEYAYLKFANESHGQLLYEDGTFSTDLPSEGAFSWGGGWTPNGEGKIDHGSGFWQPHPGCIHVHGTHGSLRVLYYANALFHRTAVGVSQVRVLDRPMPANFSMQLDAFVDAILQDKKTPVPGEEGLAACCALLGIYGGAGKPVESRLVSLRPSQQLA
jgi:UDP-N-acetyl-2-amino-2-deoxyglucuronate dehydrogenase